MSDRGGHSDGHARAPGSSQVRRGDVRRGDHELNPELDFYDPSLELRAASVLVPLVERPTGLTILLTQRADHLTSHAGQISFPGGRLEMRDNGPLACALRETEEEIGLPRSQMRPLGQMETYITRTGFEITPFVGALEPPLELNPDPAEVVEIFEVPLSFILNERNCRMECRELQGRNQYFYVYPYGERYIWGATAGMLRNFCELLAPA
ncbi:CoA pyrophosphatase [Fodinicurvata halophila]|uniref:CoA pyrophosphatase n=1 Tax=Fodinicurvata halophila TaxID=1419723 RepID=A0ABV8UMD2_9PROT